MGYLLVIVRIFLINIFLLSFSYGNLILLNSTQYNNFLFKYSLEPIKNIDEAQDYTFSKISKNKFSLGHINETIWLKLEIENRSDKENYVLNLNESFYEEVELYSNNNKQQQIQKDGFSVSIESKEYNSLNPSFDITIPQGSTQIYYIKLKSKFAKFGSLTIYEKEFYIKHIKPENKFIYIFIFGILFIILFFTLFLIFTTNDKIYVYYFCYILFYGIYLINQSGYLAYLNLSRYTYEIQALSPLIVTFLIYFSNTLLNIRKFSKRIEKVLKTIAILMVILTPFYVLFYTPWNIIVNNLYSVVFLILIFNSLYIYIKKRNEIKYYTFAISLYFCSVILFTLMISGKLEYNHLTRYGYLYASVIEVIFFSLLLANRYSSFKNKTIIAHKILIKEKNRSKILLEEEIARQTKEIRIKNRKLETLVKERELLLKELYHRVKNNFQVIISMLWFESKKYEETKQSYLEVINRIKSMSIVHNYLYNSNNMTEINIDEYLTEIINNIKLTYDKETLIINLFLEKVDIKFDDALSLGLIINEVITNAIKHHNKKKQCIIDLALKAQKNNLILSIKDNGEGFDYTNVRKGLGLNLINDFSKKLKEGNCSYSFHNGTLFQIEFSTK